MEIIAILVFVLAIIGIAVGIVLLPFKRTRGVGKNLTSGALAIFIIVLIIIGVKSDDWARKDGFENTADRSAAREAGIDDVQAWAAVKAKRQAELAAIEAQKAKEQEAADANAKAAGFIDADDRQKANDAGIVDAQKWREQQALDKAYELEQDIRNSDKRVRIVRIPDPSMPPDMKILVSIDAPGLDGGRLDFAAFAESAFTVIKFLKRQQLQFSDLQISLMVQTIDRYGNKGVDLGGEIHWDGYDIEKLNPSADRDTFLRLANKVSLNRFGREMAFKYCESHDLDRRYCGR